MGNDGKIIEHRGIRDDSKFMLQLGIVEATFPEDRELLESMEGDKLNRFILTMPPKHPIFWESTLLVTKWASIFAVGYFLRNAFSTVYALANRDKSKIG